MSPEFEMDKHLANEKMGENWVILMVRIFRVSVIVAICALVFLVVKHGIGEEDVRQIESEITVETAVSREKRLNVPLLNQMAHPKLYNGCEVTSLAMVMQYHGIVITKNELADQIRKVPLTYPNGQKGNPNEGFVGDMVNGPGLSVYHGPITELAKEYVGERAIDLTGSDVTVLYEQIDNGLPVWVIATTTLKPVNNFQTWETPQGAIDITFSVHSVVMTGYDDTHVYVNNPYGKKDQRVEKSSFEEAWIQMGRQAMVITS